ncbi:hypothetical protein C9I98_09385 [Photobacterium sanctipauli]|uniref:GNAT family N-acetyltransferase n=1 Tax=Photobacterium sanctipauli TaxID=1342794 RepID=A0A2T3NVE9_9GAMM|nr:hypothetical protein [Photobacterium sanctipauli]PSW20256.1 hypothetical protein C9I98_09385 [Photobacterium sanctipauli]
MKTISILPACREDADTVGRFVYQMEKELWPDDSDHLVQHAFIESARCLLASSGFWAFKAQDAGNTVGIITLCEKKAISAAVVEDIGVLSASRVQRNWPSARASCGLKIIQSKKPE